MDDPALLLLAWTSSPWSTLCTSPTGSSRSSARSTGWSRRVRTATTFGAGEGPPTGARHRPTGVGAAGEVVVAQAPAAVLGPDVCAVVVHRDRHGDPTALATHTAAARTARDGDRQVESGGRRGRRRARSQLAHRARRVDHRGLTETVTAFIGGSVLAAVGVARVGSGSSAPLHRGLAIQSFFAWNAPRLAVQTRPPHDPDETCHMIRTAGNGTCHEPYSATGRGGVGETKRRPRTTLTTCN